MAMAMPASDMMFELMPEIMHEEERKQNREGQWDGDDEDRAEMRRKRILNGDDDRLLDQCAPEGGDGPSIRLERS